MYSDEIKKAEYYKQRIIDNYLEEGRIVDKIKLQKYIDDIDLKLSVFRQGFINNGETLNLDKFNSQKAAVYQDLKILYELVYEMALNKISDLEADVTCRLNELSEIAKRYEYKTKLESLGIYGNTIYYSTNGFNQKYKGGRVYIDLSEVSVPSGSYVVGLLDSSEIESKDILFRFDEDNQVGDYMFNKDHIEILGNYKINTYNTTTEENYTDSFKIPVNEIEEPNEEDRYYIYAGEECIKIKYNEDSTIEYVDKLAGIPFVADKDCEISFYVYGSEYIEFNMNEEPVYKSFNDYKINYPRQRQKVLIQAKAGFALDFVTDGRIFADRSTCEIVDRELYSGQGFNNISDFMVEEIAFGDPVVFDNVQVIIENPKSSFFDINYIAIKQYQLMEIQ